MNSQAGALAPGLDWFASALDGKEAGNVSTGLDSVLRQEELRLSFVKALKHSLSSPIPHAPDRIAHLHEDIRAMEKTLRLRLSLLPLDRPQAWFRTSPPMDKSPIAATAWHDPILLAFEDSRADTVKKVLPELWRTKRIASEIYDPGFSLWGRLLKMNVRLQALNQLPAPFHDLLLEDMPEAIPDDLSSKALNEFASHLSTRIKACQRDLDACYQFLWSRSESFLQALYVQHLAMKARSGQSSESDTSRAIPKRALSPLEEALHFMNFSRLPSFDDLRNRYRTMAQALHPDRGGNEERFKLLSVHYQALLKQLQRF